MEALIFALVIAGLIQRVAADWWAGVTGRQFPSHTYRARRMELRAARHAAAGTTPPARNPARQYAADMWAYTWDGLAQRQQVRHTERLDAWRRKRQEPSGPQPMRDHLRMRWHTGPVTWWANAWQTRTDKRNRKLADSGEPADRQSAEPSLDQRPQGDPQGSGERRSDKNGERPPAPDPNRKQAPRPPAPSPDAERTPGPVGAQVIPFPTAPRSDRAGGWEHEHADLWKEAYDYARNAGAGDRALFYADWYALGHLNDEPAARPDHQTAYARYRATREPDGASSPGAPAPEGHSAGEPGATSDKPSPNSRDTNESERNDTVDTTVNAEVTGLQSARQYVASMAAATRQGSNSIESAMSGLLAGDVTGPALQHLTAAQESLAAAAGAFEQASSVLDRHQGVAEAYAANPDAGTREFVKSE
ncbi:hypothetical protein SAMN05421678_106264 [Actinopolymorpha cephalotaxi]|uniref:Uncharacterized protein n=1 Tax=Actinopolymorpha cephalotaxi TaxID=504797 RepID=A0A1I2SL02_9ACTN|nr:hypothetical protein [Actinopolymorpha cephalotaxi]NYH84013.1 hypothetical protein [Actinopolymorpha cephalotaxi]SFG53390.1 hypothetical protein SAMN05421678_106264 [Actinopolymorpha cephalotaxi]